jgi:hypothetical protein
MQAIQAPTKPGESGSRVTNVQDALRLFLERGVIRSLDPPDSPTAEELDEFGRLLAEERAESTYGVAVAVFRKAHMERPERDLRVHEELVKQVRGLIVRLSQAS